MARLVTAVLLAGGCGSTVPVTGSGSAPPGVAGQTQTALGPSVVTGTPSPGSSLAPGGTSPFAATLPGVTATAAPTSTGLPGPTSGSAPPSPATGSAMTVGVEYVQDAAALGNAAGVHDVSYGNTYADAQALVEYINAHGGLAGHRLKPLYYAFDGSGASSTTSQEQSACSFYTQDHHVAAVLTNSAHGTTYIDCLSRAGTMLVSTSVNQVNDAATYARDRLFFSPGDPNLTRLGAAEVESLYRAGYFDARPLIGLVTDDDPDFARAVTSGLVPALRRHGLAIKDGAQITPVNQESDVGAVSAQMSSAVLKFHQDHIDHVLFFSDNAGPLFFMETAEQQHYRPRYGLSTMEGGQLLASNVPPAQLHGSLSAGWMPLIDVDAAHDPAPNPAARLCLALMRSAGITFSDRTSEAVAQWYCDAGFLLQAAAAHAPSVTGTGLAAGADALGGSYLSPVTFAVTFSATRHDGVALIRVAQYSPGCACGSYTHTSYPVP